MKDAAMDGDKPVVPQSGVLAYRRRKGTLKILLVTSSDTGRWVIPKGNLEDGMTARESAEKEAYEEGGLVGKVATDSIGSYRYRKSETKGGQCCEVEVYLMKVGETLPKWPEASVRRRKWFSIKQAAELVAEDRLRELFLAFGATMAKRKGAPAKNAGKS